MMRLSKREAERRLDVLEESPPDEERVMFLAPVADETPKKIFIADLEARTSSGRHKVITDDGEDIKRRLAGALAALRDRGRHPPTSPAQRCAPLANSPRHQSTRDSMFDTAPESVSPVKTDAILMIRSTLSLFRDHLTAGDQVHEDIAGEDWETVAYNSCHPSLSTETVRRNLHARTCKL